MSEIKSRKKTFWAIWIFYILIAFEIIYMISPFAIYYYSVYGKGLNFLNDSPVTSWLTGFFLPHIAESSLFIFNVYKDIGWTLAIIGFAAFCIGAGQIYYSKLAKKQAVTGGIYNLIRHPQYASLTVCSFGLLLVWPRYIVLIMFISMLFAYYFLAKAEERECEDKFGEPYVEYKNRTHMFLPFSLTFNRTPQLRQSGSKRFVTIMIVYLIIVMSSIGLANLLKKYTISRLYTSYSNNSATISLGKIEKDLFENIISIALKDGEVQKRLMSSGKSSTTKYLNYVMPAEWYFPDIPMNDPKNIREHFSPKKYDGNFYKVLLMHAVVKPGSSIKDLDELIINTISRSPIMEVEVSLKEMKVIGIQSPPPTVRWGDIPTPIF